MCINITNFHSRNGSMQRKDDIHLLSNVTALLLVAIILVSLGYFHSNIGFLVYGQNTINNNTVVDTVPPRLGMK